MSLYTLVEAVFRHLKLFLVVAGAVFALALCWVFLTPRKYESEASILVQNARSNVLITAGNNDAPTEMREVTEEQLNSEVEVLTSKDLLDEVVQPGWNSKPRTDYSRAEWQAHEKAVRSLSRRLEASVHGDRMFWMRPSRHRPQRRHRRSCGAWLLRLSRASAR